MAMGSPPGRPGRPGPPGPVSTSRRVQAAVPWALGLSRRPAELVADLGGVPRRRRPAAPPAPLGTFGPTVFGGQEFPDGSRLGGDGQPVTLAFGGDVHFPAGTNLGDRLAADPARRLGRVPELLSGRRHLDGQLRVGDDHGTCPDAQPKQYVFYAPTTALTAFEGARITLITEANNHGEDCGRGRPADGAGATPRPGTPSSASGRTSAQAFTPYGRPSTASHRHHRRHPGHRLRPADAWTATATQPGLASAYDVPTWSPRWRRPAR